MHGVWPTTTGTAQSHAGNDRRDGQTEVQVSKLPIPSLQRVCNSHEWKSTNMVAREIPALRSGHAQTAGTKLCEKGSASTSRLTVAVLRVWLSFLLLEFVHLLT